MFTISISQAVCLLKSEKTVVLPTETVYGLAGLISSSKALKSIFSIKKRPFFDPLIVHVHSLEQASNFAYFDEISRELADYFWPGPLSLVLPKKKKVSDLITSGGPTVALRSPNHPVFQKILKKLNSPLAAPSANRFGHTSPTRVEHLFGEFSNPIPVVDGGPCSLGIESTVVEMNEMEKTLKILRPGLIGPKDLKNFFKKKRKMVYVKYESQNKARGILKIIINPQVHLFWFIVKKKINSQIGKS